MKAYAYTGASKPLSLRELPTPRPSAHQVLVRTRYCGVCHSDVHLHEGKFDLGEGQSLDLPFADGTVFGHEIYGEVADIGESVSSVRRGDMVIVYPWVGCGNCTLCNSGREHICPSGLMIGGGINAGGFGDHVLVPHERYLADAAGIAAEQAGSLACSGLTSFSAIKLIPALGPHSKVVLIGIGGLGMMGLGILRSVHGVAPIVVDVDDGKLAAASAAGAGAVVNARAPDALAKLLELTGGGADAAIDFVGSEHTAPLGFHALKTGGKLVMVGLFGGTLKLPLALIAMQVKTIEGSNVGSLANFQELVALARAGKVPPIPVNVRPAHQANEVIDDLRHGRVLGRTVLQHEQPA
ncbi:MAG: alcohol dehydrogenase catalytic domain-containing protein [Pseudomonadales bacterium]|nr:alcohol dehydrogenase catalytic domain-containing protein [Pseudomonadales bacterium]